MPSGTAASRPDPATLFRRLCFRCLALSSPDILCRCSHRSGTALGSRHSSGTSSHCRDSVLRSGSFLLPCRCISSPAPSCPAQPEAFPEAPESCSSSRSGRFPMRCRRCRCLAPSRQPPAPRRTRCLAQSWLPETRRSVTSRPQVCRHRCPLWSTLGCSRSPETAT